MFPNFSIVKLTKIVESNIVFAKFTNMIYKKRYVCNTKLFEIRKKIGNAPSLTAF